jgi:hypothetical protein
MIGKKELRNIDLNKSKNECENEPFQNKIKYKIFNDTSIMEYQSIDIA